MLLLIFYHIITFLGWSQLMGRRNLPHSSWFLGSGEASDTWRVPGWVFVSDSCKFCFYCRKQFKCWSSTPLTSMRGIRTGRPLCTWQQPIRLSSVLRWSFPCWAVSTSPTEEAVQLCTTLRWMATWRWVFSSLGTGVLPTDSPRHKWGLILVLTPLGNVIILVYKTDNCAYS